MDTVLLEKNSSSPTEDGAPTKSVGKKPKKNKKKKKLLPKSEESLQSTPGKLCSSCGTEKVTPQDALCNGCSIAESVKKISLEDKEKKKKKKVRRVVSKKKKPNLIEGKRYFGLFVCGECHNSWESANSWLGFFQKCKKCGHKVQPRKLEELIKREDVDGSDTRKRHPRELCQKCRQLGYFCRLSFRD